MHIAICQINTSVGNFKYNINKIREYYELSVKNNVDIVIFPEMTITGYPVRDLIYDSDFVKYAGECLLEFSKETTIPVIVGYVRRINDEYFNSAAICYDKKIRFIYDKILLPNYDVFDEKRYFKSGSDVGIYKLSYGSKQVNLGIEICEDLWDEQYGKKITEILHKKNAEIIINISASPFSINHDNERINVISSKINKTKIPLVYCNQVGGQDDLIFDGQSMIFNDQGEIIAKAKSFEEQLLLVDIFGKNKYQLNSDTSKEQMIFNALCLGVKDYFYKTNHTKAIIGLSGGIDSSLVAVIAKYALGPENVMGVSLPSKYSSQGSLDDSKKLAENLSISYSVIRIEDQVKSIENALKDIFKGTENGIAEENIQARIRGNILMGIANKFNLLLLSTGNKTELSLGYCTLYGDMSGALSVISDLSKTEVYNVSNWINKHFNYPIIPKICLEKLPSAELSPAQVDPFDYKLISPIIDDIVENNLSLSEIEKKYNIDLNVLKDIFFRIRNNEYKRRQAPLGLRVTRKAFGVGRRIPIVNNFGPSN